MADYLDVIRDILSFYCDSVNVLADNLENLGGDLSIILKLLDRIESYAISIHSADTICRNMILDSVYSLKANVLDSMGQTVDMIRCCESGMRVADPSQASFYAFAGWAARGSFDTGQIETGFEILARAISIAMSHNVDAAEVPSLLRLATSVAIIPNDRIESFGCALKDYATRRQGIDESEFARLWSSDPTKLLLLLAGT